MGTFDPTWEAIHEQQSWGAYPSEEVIRFVARNYYSTTRSAVRFLDLGCGAGAVTWYLAREGFETHGVDGSFSAIERAATRLRAEGVTATLHVADLAKLPYPNDHFDAVIDSAAIYANPTAAIRSILEECQRVTKPGGRFFSTGLFSVGMTGWETGERVEANTYRGITKGPLAGRGTVHFFTETEVTELWTGAGFCDIEIDSVVRTDHGGEVTVAYLMASARTSTQDSKSR